MSVTYLTTPIVEVRHDPPPRGSGMTRDGYTKRSGAPTSRMIRLQGEKRWRRLMVWQFSNLGTMFVNIDGKPHLVREEMIPQESAVTSHATMFRKGSSAKQHHATKKSPAQLQREIDEVLVKPVAAATALEDATAKARAKVKPGALEDAIAKARAKTEQSHHRQSIWMTREGEFRARPMFEKVSPLWFFVRHVPSEDELRAEYGR